MPEHSAARPKPPPKQARAAAKREAILDAAEHLLNTHTPDMISTRKIAETADISVGSIYRYFTDIDDLMQALFKRMNAGTLTLLRSSLDHEAQEWRDHLNAIFSRLAQMHAAHPAYGMLMAHVERPDEDQDEIALLLDGLLQRDAPHLDRDMAHTIVRTTLALIDGVERRLARIPEEKRQAALVEARIAVQAYLTHHLDSPP